MLCTERVLRAYRHILLVWAFHGIKRDVFTNSGKYKSNDMSRCLCVAMVGLSPFKDAANGKGDIEKPKEKIKKNDEYFNSRKQEMNEY